MEAHPVVGKAGVGFRRFGRVVARPGDRFQIRDGQVVVNGEPIDQSFITESGEITPDPVNFPVVTARNGEVTGFQGLLPNLPTDVDAPETRFYYGSTIDALAPIPADAPAGRPFLHELIIPEGHYFVMGDNREAAAGGSEDSRYFGPIPRSAIVGRAAPVWTDEER